MRALQRSGESGSVFRRAEKVRRFEKRVQLGLGNERDVFSISPLDDVRLARFGDIDILTS